MDVAPTFQKDHTNFEWKQLQRNRDMVFEIIYQALCILNCIYFCPEIKEFSQIIDHFQFAE